MKLVRINIVRLWALNIWLFVLGCCWADPIDRPAELWMEYDLIAEVDILSLDSQKEIRHSVSGASQGFGHVATVEVRRALRSPSDTNQWTIVVPTYVMYDGNRLPVFPFEEQLSNPVPQKIACKWSKDRSWMVLAELLPEELWTRYEGQKNANVTNMPPRMSESMRRFQEQHREVGEAREKIWEYDKQLDSGTITEEQYKQLTEPLEKIVQQPISLDIK